MPADLEVAGVSVQAAGQPEPERVHFIKEERRGPAQTRSVGKRRR